MRTTIDKAGRIVIPRQLRDEVGLEAGPVEVIVDGAGVRIEPVSEGEIIEQVGRLVIPRSGQPLSDEAVAVRRNADRR